MLQRQVPGKRFGNVTGAIWPTGRRHRIAEFADLMALDRDVDAGLAAAKSRLLTLVVDKGGRAALKPDASNVWETHCKSCRSWVFRTPSVVKKLRKFGGTLADDFCHSSRDLVPKMPFEAFIANLAGKASGKDS